MVAGERILDRLAVLVEVGMTAARDHVEVGRGEHPDRELAIGASPGVVDAAGGLWEWTASWFDSRRVLRALRGGCWNDPIPLLRCAYRGGLQPADRRTIFGFRCAQDLPAAGSRGSPTS